MKPRYYDILKCTDKPPIWWDERGVPRFETFVPNLHVSPHSMECVLFNVCCQCCYAPYVVCMSSHRKFVLREQILTKQLNYGDSPIGCFKGSSETQFLKDQNPALLECGMGHATTAEPKNIIGFWERSNPLREWIEDVSFRNSDIS